MNGQITMSQKLSKVDWLTRKELYQLNKAWKRLIAESCKDEPSPADAPTIQNTASITPAAFRSRAREILLGASREFKNDVASVTAKQVVGGWMHDRWEVAYSLTPKLKHFKIDFHVLENAAEEPIKVYATNKHMLPIPEAVGFYEIGKAGRIPENISEFKLERLPQFPKIVAEIDLSASDVSIKESIKKIRIELGINGQKDSLDRSKSSGRPKKTEKPAAHYFELYILMQLNTSIDDCLKWIRTRNNHLNGLSKETLEKQIEGLRIFVDPKIML